MAIDRIITCSMRKEDLQLNIYQIKNYFIKSE